jgi:CheY-like chemotaxis protein
MPEMNGFQLLAAKNEDPALRDIPVVVISARDPAGQLIVSDSLTVTRGGGLSVPQLLASIEALSRILAPAGWPGGPTPTATRPE